MKNNILWQGSPWLILVCVAVGALYAWLLYQKKSTWSVRINRILAGSRFILVTIICLLLLLNPYLRQIINKEERPAVVLAVDNSQSILAGIDTTRLKNIYTRLDDVAEKLRQKGLEVDIQTLDASKTYNKLQGIKPTMPQSNLGTMLNAVKNNYENRNLDKVVLISDGIHNQGLSPLFSNFTFPIYTLALGDTTPKRDLRIRAVLANKVAYQGNEFPIVAEVENYGFPNKSITAYLSQNGAILDKKNITFKGDGDLQSVTFQTTAKQKGIQHYQVSIDVVEGEFTAQNNVRDVYVEVIEGKEKVLVVAMSPHPDIKALRSAIDKNENYSFDLHIPNVNQLKPEKYDIVIFHQIPNVRKIGNELLERFKDLPAWFILGAQTDLNEFNRIYKDLKITGRSGRTDQVTPAYNKTFAKFTFDNAKSNLFDKLPPVTVPFAEYTTSNAAEVILNQRVGNLATEKPLLVVSQDATRKTAVLAGENSWQWRMEEFARQGSHESYDELVGKLVQFLSTKEDKRRLRVYPINQEFYDFEKVVFESELYNEIYERVYGQKITLTLTNEAGKTTTYNFTPSEGNTRFEISDLPQGVYSYSAVSETKGGVERSTGEFTVRSMQLESLNTTADHNLLRQLSDKTNGKFFPVNQIDRMAEAILSNIKPNLIHSTEEISEFINLKWIFFLLLALATFEWATRKYQGGY
jgi:uncharacterized protein YeeX (DUF496 family)